MKDIFADFIKWSVKITLTLIVFGWVSYEKAESFVDKKIETAIKQVVTLEAKDIDGINKRFDTLEEQNNMILSEMIKRK